MPDPTDKLRLVYDGLCPMCIRTAGWVKVFDRRDRVEFVDFNRVDPATIHPALDRETCVEAMQLVTPDGSVRSGYHAFKELTRRLWLLWPLAAVLSIPGVTSVGTRVYRFVAARRRRLTCDDGVCARHAEADRAPVANRQA